MTEQDARALYASILAELKAAGTAPADFETRWSFGFNKARRGFGVCRHRSRDDRSAGGRIELSLPIVLLNGEREVGATVRHEIAHALAGFRAGHGPAWVRIAKLCGDDGRRCYSDEVETPDLPWIAECPGCGREVGRTRPVKPGRLVSCGICRPGRFDPRFALNFRMRQTEFSTTAQDAPTLKKIIELRKAGLGWVKVDAALGVHGKKGFHSWKIFNDAAKGGGE